MIDFRKVRVRKEQTPPYLPTAEEIATACEEIQAKWSEDERRVRSTFYATNGRSQARVELAEKPWQPPGYTLQDVRLAVESAE